MMRLLSHKRRKSFVANEKGSVTVEFVITLPLLLLALVFIFEFSNLFWSHHIAVNNVRSATRFLSRAPNDGGSTNDILATYLTEAENIARTGDPLTPTGDYDWMKDSCEDGGICVDINQNFAAFTETDFRVDGKVIRVAADVPLPMPLFGLVNAFSGGTAPLTITFRIVEETRYFAD